MDERRKQDRRSKAAKRSGGGIWLTALIGLIASAFAIAGLLYWSTSTADRLSRERQERIAANVLAQSLFHVAHDQESVTVWDDALLKLRQKPLDYVWLDNSVGLWLYQFYGHDAVYMLDSRNRPLYAMADGKRGRPSDFAAVRSVLLPLANDLRANLRRGGTQPSNQLNSGIVDLIIVGGRPAIVSIKPFVSNTGKYLQIPGTQTLHVSMRWLDGSLLKELRTQFGLDGARVSLRNDSGPHESMKPLRDRYEQAKAYFIWTPFAPGSAVFGRLAPVLLGAFALITIIVLALLSHVTTGTRKLHESRAAAQHLAFHDPMTGLPNRSLFDDRLDHALNIYRETAEHRVALLCLDLDRFKQVNDTLGHPAGDELIREFARRLNGIIRVTDTAARLGGDEFAIIQTEVSSFEETELLCRRIIEAASEPFLLAGTQAFVGVSIGVALAGKDGLDANELTRKADIALYESKAHGRGRHKFFAPSMDEPIRAREAAERDLRAAIEAGDQLSVAYQPQYSALTGEIVGAEALVRWEHPENGTVPPAAFIPVAEETGLIEPLGEWVMAEACKAAKDWPIETISINVSPVQLRNPHFGYRAIGIISDSGIDPSRVELEITETALIDSAAQFAVNLRLLRAFGIRIALDDFGTGYSSFSHLREFEVDRVKIDRTFVDKISADAGGSALIRAIIDLAKSTGLQTTAEGVETDEQKKFLETVGCNELQGFFMAHPMPSSEIEKLLGTKARPVAFDDAFRPKKVAG